MDENISNLSDLIRKVESNYHNPRVHGQGFIVTWHNKKNEVVNEGAILSDFFNKKYYEYFFVKLHTKPVVIKKLPFSWYEGASEIALDFYATFQLRVSDEVEAKQLVEILSMSGIPERGLLNLIDKHLHICMSNLYAKCTSMGEANLLDEFYQQALQRGESSRLNQAVTEQMTIELKGMDFNIGFTLRNAPERYADFNYQTQIQETGLEVSSECQLMLNNYQAYRKSEIKDIDGVIQYMKEGIDRAIRQHILGKSEMDLLSNFKTATSQSVSISDQVKQSVQAQANAIGYELNSFHTLPNIAPLRLLNGLMLTFDKDDGAFKTGMFGSRVRLNIRLEIKAQEGQFEKYRHLFASAENDNQIDLLGITQAQILDRIKILVHDICKEVMLNDQFNHYEALSQFEKVVRPTLTQEITTRLEEQHGLKADVKSLMAVESEDAMRLEELRGQKVQINFKRFFNTEQGGAEYTFNSAFEVLGLVKQTTDSWETFEKWDFGYCIDSPERQTKAMFKSESDVVCKKRAIESELHDIHEEIVRLLNASPLLIPSIDLWVNKREFNSKLQAELLNEVTTALKSSRGMDIFIERLEIKDEDLIKAQLGSRGRKLESIAKTEQINIDHMLDGLEQQHGYKKTLADEIVEKQKDFLVELDDFDDLEESQALIRKEYPDTRFAQTSLMDMLPNSQKVQTNALEELTDVLSPSKEALEDKGNE